MISLNCLTIAMASIIYLTYMYSIVPQKVQAVIPSWMCSLHRPKSVLMNEQQIQTISTMLLRLKMMNGVWMEIITVLHVPERQAKRSPALNLWKKQTIKQFIRALQWCVWCCILNVMNNLTYKWFPTSEDAPMRGRFHSSRSYMTGLMNEYSR